MPRLPTRTGPDKVASRLHSWTVNIGSGRSASESEINQAALSSSSPPNANSDTISGIIA
jgi:hypothetical protein